MAYRVRVRVSPYPNPNQLRVQQAYLSEGLPRRSAHTRLRVGAARLDRAQDLLVRRRIQHAAPPLLTRETKQLVHERTQLPECRLQVGFRCIRPVVDGERFTQGGTQLRDRAVLGLSPLAPALAPTLAASATSLPLAPVHGVVLAMFVCKLSTGHQGISVTRWQGAPDNRQIFS